MDNQSDQEEVGNGNDEERVLIERSELPSGHILVSFGKPNTAKNTKMLQAFCNEMLEHNRNR